MAWGLLGIPTDLVLPALVPPLALDTSVAPLLDVAVSALRHAPLLVLVILQLYSVGAGASEAPEEKCSKALGFNESMAPRDRAFQDLQFCNEHHKRTCCEKNHTRQVLAQFGPFSHERSTRCTQMSKLALCSMCDGDVGAAIKSRLNSIMLCPSFCAQWFQACAEDLFAASGGSGALVPCMPSMVVCSPLGEITEDPAVFCRSMSGFAVADSEDSEEEQCYDGVPAARSRGKGEKQPYTRPQAAVPPWWRKAMKAWSDQMVYLQRDLQRMRLPKWIAGYMPAIIVGSVGVLFLLCVLRG